MAKYIRHGKIAKQVIRRVTIHYIARCSRRTQSETAAPLSLSVMRIMESRMNIKNESKRRTGTKGFSIFALSLLFFYILCSAKIGFPVEFIPDLHGTEVEKVLRSYGNLHGIAVETWLDGHFFDSVGIVFVDLERKMLRRISFNFKDIVGETSHGNVLYQELHMTKIKKHGPQKILLTGTTADGYSFFGECSIREGQLIFIITIQGRGTVEIRNLSFNGMRLKNRYLPNLDLGLVSRPLLTKPR